MRASIFWCALVAAFALVAGCASETKQVVASTQVTLEVAIAPSLLAQLDELRAALLVDRGAGFVERSRVSIGKAQLKPYVDLPIVPSESADERLAFEVLVEARGGGAVLAQRRVAARFTQGEHIHLPVALDTTMLDPSTAQASGDGGVAASDAGAPDAGRTCPLDHTCKPPFPCVPTALGYTCRGQFADWPMPDSVAGAKVAPHYTVIGDTVIDDVTKLEWQVGIPPRYPGCTVEVTASGVNLTMCTRDQARRYCDELTHAGKGDWRLPSRIELVSLLQTHYQGGAPSIEDRHFGEFNYYIFMSDSTSAVGAALTWQVNFYNARVFASNDAARVRCVRAGAEPPFATPADRYAVDPVLGTVTDRATGLVWQRQASPSPLTLVERTSYCQAQPGGFHAATTNELLSLVDPTRATPPLLDSQAFPGTPFDAPFLTGSAKDNPLSFETGELDWIPETTGYVRCVR